MMLLSMTTLLLMCWFLLLSRHVLSMLLTLELIFLQWMLRFSLYAWMTDDVMGILMAFVLLMMAGLETSFLLSQMLLYHRHQGQPHIVR